MRSIGSYEAKTHLPRLLDEVAAGEEIVITKHGVPVARLVPPDGRPRRNIDEVIEEIHRLRQSIKPVPGPSIREMIDEGRRF